MQYANSHASETDKTDAILDWTPNLSYLDNPLGMPIEEESTEYPSAIAKLIIAVVVNYGATAICFQQAVAAHNA